jgi:hypothetical protein
LGGILETAEGGNNYTGELCAHIDAAVDAGEGWAATSGVPVRVAYVYDATSPVRAEARFRTRHDRTTQGYFASHLLNSMGWFRDRTEVALQLWQTSHVGSPTNEWADVEAARFAAAEEGASVAVALVRRVRMWRLAWLRRRVGRAVTHGGVSLSFDVLLTAAFGRTFRVSPDPVSVASVEHGPFGRVAGWDELAYRALRARRELGGARGWEIWKKAAERRRVAEQAKRMRTWRAIGSLSGAPYLEVVEVQVVVEIAPRARVGAARRERSAREAAGLQQQRDGRWAVARVVEARRERSGGVLALVEWKGANPVTGVA